jgi:hypothetical protein
MILSVADAFSDLARATSGSANGWGSRIGRERRPDQEWNGDDVEEVRCLRP